MTRRGDAIYHRKDGLWEARYVKEIDMSGKKKYGSVYGHSYREVKAKRQDALDHILLYQNTAPLRQVTVNDLATEWLMVNRHRLKPSTVQRYEGFLKNHIKTTIGTISAVYMTTISIHQFAASRLSNGLAPQSVNAILTFLHSILKYGHRQYRLPMPEIIYLSCEKKEMRVFSQEEQRVLVSFLKMDMDICKLGVLTALYTGLRIGELCALRWVDIEDDSITVRRTVQRLCKPDGSGTELHIGPPKTKTSLRRIPIPSFLKEIIDSFRKTELQDSCFLSTYPGDIMEPRLLQYRFKGYLKSAGISEANFHALRHTFATRCVEAGFEIKSLSEILGHANVQITLNKYVHSSFALKQANMELLKPDW